MSCNIPTCRICLDTKFESHVAFDSASAHSKSSNWTYLMEFCVGIKIGIEVMPESVAPKMLCKSCADKLIDFFNFKTKCLKSEEFWTKMTLKKNTNDKPTIDDTDDEDCMAVECPSFDLSGTQTENDDNATDTKIQQMQKNVTEHDANDDDNNQNIFKVFSVDSIMKRGIKREDIGSCSYDLPIDSMLKIEIKTEECSDTEPLKVENYVVNENFETVEHPATLGKKTRFSYKQTKALSTLSTKCTTVKREKPPSLTKSVKPMTKNLSKKNRLKTKEKYLGMQSKVTLNYGDFDMDVNKKTKIDPNKPKAREQYCGMCKFQCKKLSGLRKHWQKHIAKNDLQCKLCEYVGRDFADMAAHRNKHLPSKLTHTVRCLLCTQIFVYGRVYKVLEHHYRKMHLGKKGGWCIECGKEFKSYIVMKHHEASHKSGGNSFVCDHCGKSFLLRHNLKVHINQVHSETCLPPIHKRDGSQGPVLNVKCDHCDEMFPTRYKMYIHKKEVQGISFVCETCGVKFYYENQLRTHRTLHSEKSHTCAVCEKKFHFKGSLKMHMQRHTGTKPHKCPQPQCDKTFQTTTQARRHEQAIHFGIRPVKCAFETCERTFSNTFHMRLHYGTHFKDKKSKKNKKIKKEANCENSFTEGSVPTHSV